MLLSSSSIKTRAKALGFDVCGIAPATELPELRFFDEWLARGYAGEMAYLHRSADRRTDVRRILPSARTVVVTGTLYNTGVPYSTESNDPGRAKISRYAWGDDYHDIIGQRIEALLAWMRDQSSEPFDARAYVDTGPVQERVYARHAGIGWIGKNTCVINPELGSFLFLAEIICSLALEVDEPAFDHCGSCTLCIEACPTRAIAGPGVLDATRCISYLTIEQRGPIPDEFASAVGSYVYGCDICQEVCPWNQMAPHSDDPAWQRRPVWADADVAALSQKSDAELADATRGSAMRRAKVAGLRRNLGVALSACGHASTQGSLEPLRRREGAEQLRGGGPHASRERQRAACEASASESLQPKALGVGPQRQEKSGAPRETRECRGEDSKGRR